MGCPKGPIICFYEADTEDTSYEVTDSGSPLSITGWTITFTVNNPGSFTKNATIINGPGGLATLSLTSADTISIGVGNYEYSVKFVDSGGDLQKSYVGELQCKGTI